MATVARLVADGRMRPAGLAAVGAAQADGRWERAYAGPATITVPDDLATALAAEPAAGAAFAALDGTNRYAVLWGVHTAATPATRAKRVAALVAMLAEGRRLTTEGGPRCPGPVQGLVPSSRGMRRTGSLHSRRVRPRPEAHPERAEGAEDGVLRQPVTRRAPA